MNVDNLLNVTNNSNLCLLSIQFPDNTVLSSQSSIVFNFQKSVFYTPYINLTIMNSNHVIKNDVVLSTLNTPGKGMNLVTIYKEELEMPLLVSRHN